MLYSAVLDLVVSPTDCTCLNPGCYCADPSVENESPPPNMTIAELEGPTNITFNCDVYENVQVSTLWSYRLPSASARIIVNPDDHLEFVINGTVRENPIPFPTFRNRLTVVNMTSRLDGAQLFCGHARQGFNELAMWTLRVYRESHCHALTSILIHTCPVHFYTTFWLCTCTCTPPTHSGPPLLSGGQLVKVAEGDAVGVDIEDVPEAYPTPTPSTYQWRRLGEGVMSDSRVTYSYADVLFSSVQRTDSGPYTLTATNHRLDSGAVIGTDTGNFTLDVLCECISVNTNVCMTYSHSTDGPDITAEGVGYSVPEGGEVTLVCGRGLSSNPPAEISWFNPSGSLISRDTPSSEEEVVSLRLPAVRANDSGVWRCELRVRDPEVVMFNGGMLIVRNNTEIGSRSIPVYLTVVGECLSVCACVHV